MNIFLSSLQNTTFTKMECIIKYCILPLRDNICAAEEEKELAKKGRLRNACRGRFLLLDLRA